MGYLVDVLTAQDNYEEAKGLCRHALDLMKKVFGDTDLETLDSKEDMAEILENFHEYYESDELRRYLIDLRIKEHGKEYERTMTAIFRLVRALQKRGEHSQAEGLYRELCDFGEDKYGEEHWDHLLEQLAMTLRSQSRDNEAEGLCCNPLLDCFLCDSRSLLLAVLCLFWPYMGPWAPHYLDILPSLLPHCNRLHRHRLSLLKARYGDTDDRTLDCTVDFAVCLE